MTERNYTAIPSPEIKSLLDGALPQLAAEIGDLRLPKLAGVVLGGGYGRGEGGVLHTRNGDKLYNDLDFFVFSERASAAEAAGIDRELGKLSGAWERRLGVAVDFGPVKELSSLRRLAGKLMYQELVRGWIPVWGDADPGEWIPLLPPELLPFSEAARLLLNRGMGMVLAGERLAANSSDADFIMRNLHKSQLGAGDALLIAAKRYRWSGPERLAALEAYVSAAGLPERIVENYINALRYKAEPCPVLPADPATQWRECRECLMAAARHIAGCSEAAAPREIAAGLHRRAQAERSLRNGLRWLLRTGTARAPAQAFAPPEVSVAGMLCTLLAGGSTYPACPPRLRRMWNIFN